MIATQSKTAMEYWDAQYATGVLIPTLRLGIREKSMRPRSIDEQLVTIDANGTEEITPEIVAELDAIFSDFPGVDTVALASLLLKLTGKWHRIRFTMVER